MAAQEPSLPHPPGASGSSACGQSHGSGLLNIPQCSYCIASPSSGSVIEMQDGARHVALNTLRLPPTSSPWPAGARAPGLLSPPPPLAGSTPAVLGSPGAVSGTSASLSQQRTPRPSPGPGDQSRAHSGKSPLGLGLALSPAAPPRDAG